MNRRFVRDAVLLAGAAVVLRIVVLWILPDSAISLDVIHTREVADRLARGENPYITTAFLNWPPFWMQVIFVLHRIASATGMSLDHAVVALLIAADAINIVLALYVAQRFLRLERPNNVLFLGLVANPVSLVLVCQHRHFDALVVTAMLVFAVALLRFRESHDVTDWLAASFALGIGTLMKTIPIFLAPLLAFDIWRANRRARILGVLLLITPALIGMSVIYALAPREVARNVLGYRSYPGWFGITGVLELAHFGTVESMYAKIFPLLLIVALFVFGRRLARTGDVRSEQLVLAIAVLLGALIAFAPGYATQYIAWPLPFFVLSYFGFDARWRSDLRVAWIIAVATYLFEYGVMMELGRFLVAFRPSPQLIHLSDIYSEPGLQTLVRLPLFATYLWLAFAGGRRLRVESRAG